MTENAEQLSFAAKIKRQVVAVLHSGSNQNERPYLREHNEGNIPDLFIIGDLAGAPVIKYAMAQGYEVIEHIATLPGALEGADAEVFDVIIVGAGAAGLNAALQAQERGMRYVLIEKEQMANTIENFPEAKWVYAEPDSQPPKGKLWLDGASKEELTHRWHQIVRQNHLNLRTMEAVLGCEKRDGLFHITTSKGQYRSKRVVLATGQRGNPRKLNVRGEDRGYVYHRLYSPRKYKNENILVVGGGNSAIEAALTLSEQNKVCLSYRGSEFSRIFKDNERKLKEAIGAGRIEPLLNSTVSEFGEHEATLKIRRGTSDEIRQIPCDHAFVLIGADVPRQFLKSLGLKMENEWEGSLLRAAVLTLLGLLGFWILGGRADGAVVASIPGWVGLLVSLAGLGGLIHFGRQGDRFSWLGLSCFVWYTIYGAKLGKGEELWPYRNWGY
ncbi:MAG: NAD(P)-binding domain-containing protein, partial [Acidobacteria bacterium]|nr:NAD(P)-binding domain-containing protein [Acidobacteriota bacterium]